MPHFRFSTSHGRRTALALLLALAAAGACDRRESTPAAGETSAAPPGVTPQAARPGAVSSGWSPDAGLALLLPGPSEDLAFVVLPEVRDTLAEPPALDTTSLVRSPLVLFGRGGDSVAARFAGTVDSVDADGCVPPWPAVRVAADRPLAGWAAGLVGARARAIAMDSLDALSSADSSAIAAEAARLASTLPVSDETTFRGLPFALQAVHRFVPAPGRQAFVALLQRRLNLEAAPREEQTLVIAERDSASGGRYEVAYHERSAGTEESIESRGVLAALALGAGARTALVLVRDGADHVVYSLVERAANGRWRVSWTSAVGKC